MPCYSKRWCDLSHLPFRTPEISPQYITLKRERVWSECGSAAARGEGKEALALLEVQSLQTLAARCVESSRGRICRRGHWSNQAFEKPKQETVDPPSNWVFGNQALRTEREGTATESGRIAQTNHGGLGCELWKGVASAHRPWETRVQAGWLAKTN
jgi:hypothetical protein